MEINNDKSKNNYISLIKANEKYMKYISSHSLNNEFISKEEINYLIVGYISVSLLLFKDEYIKKDEYKNLSTTLNSDIIEKYSKIVSTKVDNKYKIGDITFNSPIEVIDKIRNKLAHGDYEIKDNNVIIEVEDSIGEIEIDKLLSLSTTIDSTWEKFQLGSENKFSYIATSIPNDNFKLNTKEDINNLLVNSRYIEIKDNPIPPAIRNEQYAKMVNFFIDKAKRETTNGVNIEDLVKRKNIKSILDRSLINIKVKETKINNLNSSNKIKNKLLSKLSFISNIKVEEQLKYIGILIHSAELDTMPKKDIFHGLMLNELILKKLKEDITIKEQDIINDYESGYLLVLENEKIQVVTTIIQFYFNYIYGLEQVLNNNDNEHIIDIVENKLFDFSKLDLSNIKPSSIIVEKEYSYFPEQIEKIKKDILVLNDRYNKIDTNIKRLSSIKGKEDKLEELITLRNEIKLQQDKKLELLDKCNDFMLNNYNNYKYNRAVIEHLRNCIAHGNIKIDIFRPNYEVEDTVVMLNDIFKDNNTFSLETTLEEFNTLFNEHNLNEIYNFLGLDNNTKETHK